MLSNLKESLIKTIDEIEKKEKEKYTDGMDKILITNDEIEELSNKNMISSIPGRSLTEKKENISKAKFLDELHISLEQAKNILENNGYEFILDESDRNIVKGENNHNYGGEIAFVRLTDSIPKNNKILRKIDENVMDIVEGSFGEIKIPATRETLHFCACSEVADTGFSTWSNKKIAIIIPLKELPKDMKVTSHKAADFQVKDNVSIPASGWIICPKSEFENTTKNNPGCHIIPYDGDNVNGFANTLLTYLGYEYHQISEHDFVDNKPETYERKVKEHFNLSKIEEKQHSSTIEHQEECTGKVRNLFIAFREAIKNGEIKYNEETKSEVHSKIEMEFDSLAKIDVYEKLGLLKELSINKEDIELTRSSDLNSFLMEKIIEALDKEKEEFNRKHGIKENEKDDKIIENAEKQVTSMSQQEKDMLEELKVEKKLQELGYIEETTDSVLDRLKSVYDFMYRSAIEDYKSGNIDIAEWGNTPKGEKYLNAEKLSKILEKKLNKELRETEDSQKIISELEKMGFSINEQGKIDSDEKWEQMLEMAEKQAELEKQQEINDKSNATDNLKDIYEEERVEPADLKKAQKQVEATINQERNQPKKEGEENGEY